MSAPRHPARSLRLLPAFAALLLSACQHLVAPPAPPQAPARPAEALRTLAGWEANGKLSLRYLGQSVSATYRWTRQGDDYDAEAAGPLDQGHTHVFSHQGLMTLENGWLGRHETFDPEGLTRALTGLPLPLQHLNAWLMGWPALPGTPLLPATEGQVRAFSEQGWDIHVLAEQDVAGYRIPQRLTITRGDDRLLLSLSRWQPAQP